MKTKTDSAVRSVIKPIFDNLHRHMDAVDQVQWVRGVTLAYTTRGVGYVDGKLSVVEIDKTTGGEYQVDARPVGIKEAAEVMLATHASDVMFHGEGHTDDDGWKMFLQQIQAELPK